MNLTYPLTPSPVLITLSPPIPHVPHPLRCSLGETHPLTTHAWMMRCEALLKKGHLAEAKRSLSDCIAVQVTPLGPFPIYPPYTSKP